MDHYAALDVSLEVTMICVVNAQGKKVREAKVPSEPQPLIDWFAQLGLPVMRIGLEAGPLSQWLYGAMKKAGLPVELLETRQVHAVLKANPVKTDRNDALGMAQLLRMGWVRSVHCKSEMAQQLRALLTARKLIVSKLCDFEMSLRGILRGFGLKVGKTTANYFARRIEELVVGHAILEVIAKSMLNVHETLLKELKVLDKQVRGHAKDDTRARLLMSAPGVGVIVSMTYLAGMDDPSRFTSSKKVGPHFGLTPRKYQSGEKDVTGHITKCGDGAVRAALYEAAHAILTKPIKGATELKSWAMRLAKRAGMKRAKVALARKLAVILHKMLVTNTPFGAHKASSAQPAVNAKKAA